MLPVNAEVLGLKTMSASGDGQQQYVPPNQGTSQGSDSRLNTEHSWLFEDFQVGLSEH